MTILFDATVAVKPARNARRFGQGLLATYPTYRSDHTAADAAWLLADDLRREEAAKAAFNAELEAMFEESLAVERMSLGYC